MNDDLYWDAQWAINVLEEQRARMTILESGHAALDVLLRLKR